MTGFVVLTSKKNKWVSQPSYGGSQYWEFHNSMLMGNPQVTTYTLIEINPTYPWPIRWYPDGHWHENPACPWVGVQPYEHGESLQPPPPTPANYKSIYRINQNSSRFECEFSGKIGVERIAITALTILPKYSFGIFFIWNSLEEFYTTTCPRLKEND